MAYVIFLSFGKKCLSLFFSVREECRENPVLSCLKSFSFYIFHIGCGKVTFVKNLYKDN